MSSVIDKKALEVANHIWITNSEVDDKYAFDPLVLIALASLMIQAVVALYSCYKSHDKVAAAIRKPGIINRWKFRRMAKKAFVINANRVVASMYAIGLSIRDDEIVQMHEEALRKNEQSPTI